MSNRPPRRGKRRQPPRKPLPPELTSLADMGTMAVGWMLAGEPEKAGEIVADIAERGPMAVHATLWGWSLAVLALPTGTHARNLPRGNWGVVVEDPSTGEDVGIGRMEQDQPGMADAVRLIACAGNQDHDTVMAIVECAWQDETGQRLAELMHASLSLAVAAVRRAGERAGGDPDAPS